MAITFYGNKGKAYKNANYVSLAPANRMSVYASAALDVAIVDAATLLRPGANFGVTFQLAQSIGTLKIELTLAEREVAIRTPALAAWNQLVAALANNAMQGTALLFTFARLTFTEPGKCFIASV